MLILLSLFPDGYLLVLWRRKNDALQFSGFDSRKRSDSSGYDCGSGDGDDDNDDNGDDGDDDNGDNGDDDNGDDGDDDGDGGGDGSVDVDDGGAVCSFTPMK
ncbi:unnamed protein product, partial [Acanthocheilonema viteae]